MGIGRLKKADILLSYVERATFVLFHTFPVIELDDHNPNS